MTQISVSRSVAVKQNAPVIEKLQHSLKKTFHEIGLPKREYAILDFPNYPNIGDSAIYLGELELCRQYFGRDPILVTEARDEDIEQVGQLDKNVVLLLQGGGNFGDLYPRHQKFREAILERFPDRKTVLLPQSIYFKDETNALAFSDIVRRHSDFTMMVRDTESLDFARKYFACVSVLAPDAAFMLGALGIRCTPRFSVGGLIRNDIESTHQGDEILRNGDIGAQTADWKKDPDVRGFGVGRLPRVIRRLLPPAIQWIRPEAPGAYEHLASRRVERGLMQLCESEVGITDRLHAHILYLLLGIPHVVLDNIYNKIKRFDDAWMIEGAFVRAKTVQEAAEMANKFVSNQH